MRKYQFGFDYYALILFASMMVPTIFWSFFEAPNDVFRAESVTPVIDTVASVSQFVMIASLCMFRNRSVPKTSLTPKVVASIRLLIFYYFGWVLYYLSVVNAGVILLLTIPPCLAFLLFSIDRKNIISIISSCVFMLCHLIFAAANFII